MKRTMLVMFAMLVVSLSAVAQIPVNTFSLNFTPLSLPSGKQTVMGTEAGATFTPAVNWDLREDNILAPGSNFQFFGGGFNYRLPVLSVKLNNASQNLDGSRFQFYVTGSAGVDRITAASTTQHYAFLAGGGINYALSASGTWALGAEVRYAKFPGLANNTFVVALGPSVHF